MVTLTLLGGTSLTNEGGVITGPAAHRHRLALLALLAAASSRSQPRDKLMALLWPERDAEHARRLLNQAVYVLRKALGEGVIRSAGEELRLDPGILACDLIAFEEALSGGRLEEAVAAYGGPFLDGFSLSGALEFERWVEVERARLGDLYAGALVALAEAAEEQGDRRAALEWWKARAAHDPYDSRVARRLMEALAAVGNPAGAIRYASEHADLLRDELGAEPPPEVTALAERLRREPPPHLPRVSGGDDVPGAERPRAPREQESTEGSREARRGSPVEARARAGAVPRRWLGRTAGVVLLMLLFLAVVRLEPGSEKGLEGPANHHENGAGAAPELMAPVALPDRCPRSSVAYDFFIQGTSPALVRTAGGARKAFDDLLRAVELEPSCTVAWAELACMAFRVAEDDQAGRSRADLHGMAREAALTAVSQNDSSAAAQAALGLVRMAEFDFSAAERRLKRALAIDSTRSRASQWLVSLYLWTDRPGAALAEAGRALTIDPSPAARAEWARALAANGRCVQALAELGTLHALEPPLLRVPPVTALCHVRQQQWDEAIRVLRSYADRVATPSSEALLGYVLARAGHREEAHRIRSRLTERWQGEGHGAFPVALVVAGLEHGDHAIEWLDRALQDGSLTGLPPHLQLLGFLREPLARHPRFHELGLRLGLDPGRARL